MDCPARPGLLVRAPTPAAGVFMAQLASPCVLLLMSRVLLPVLYNLSYNVGNVSLIHSDPIDP